MKLASAARSRIVAVLLLVVVLAAVGVWQVLRLPSSIFPEVTFPLVKVIANVGEEPAARMMPTVTRPLEEAMLRVPGVRTVKSATSRGSCELSGQFAWGTDMALALQRVDAEIERIRPSLPAHAQVHAQWMNTAISPILGYSLTSQTRTQAELLELAEYTIKPALLRVPGIAEVQIQGGRKREFRIDLDRRALEARQLSIADVLKVVKQQNQVLSAGLTEQNHELYLTLVDGRVHGIDALQRITVPTSGGLPATLAELGRITVADEVSYVRTTADGREAVLLNIIRQPAANTLSIASGIDALLKKQPKLVPTDVRWATFYDQARFVRSSVNGTRDAILIGIGLAALVLLVFLRNWRLTAVAVAAVPLCVAIVALALGAFGQTVNLMTLAGVAAAIGLIADDAIVVIENVHRHVDSGGRDPYDRGLTEIFLPMIGSSLSSVVIFLPFAFLTGVVGAFFRPLALTMGLSLVVSFFLAVLVVPASAATIAPAPHRERVSWWRRIGERPSLRRIRAGWSRGGRRAGHGYHRLTGFVVAHGIIAVVIVVVCLVGAYWLYRTMPSDFLPQMDEGSIILDYWTPPGTSLTDTDAMLRNAEKVIMAMPDVATYSRRTGTQLGFFITEPNRGDYVINLKPRNQRRPIEEVMNDLREQLAHVEPAMHTDFGQLLEDNLGDLTGGEPQPIDVRLFMNDQNLLQQKAQQVAKIVARLHGTEDVFDGVVIAGPSLEVTVQPELAARYGFTTESIESEVEPAVTGTVIDQIRVGERLYDLRLFARTPSPLPAMHIRAPSGALVRLDDVATVATGRPEAEIDRENLLTYVGVTGRLSGRDLGSTIAELRQKLQRELPASPGLTIRFGGMYEQQQKSFRDLLYVLVGCLVLVSIVALFQFGDWRAPLLTAVLSLSTLAGVFLALRLTGMTLNISSYVGAIMMVGIVGEHTVFVINAGRRELRSGATPREAWTRASRSRIRPVTMTTLATGFALAPLAFAIGQGAQLMQPLAIAVIGGFVFSAPLVLLVLPALYCLLDRHGRLGRRADASVVRG